MSQNLDQTLKLVIRSLTKDDVIALVSDDEQRALYRLIQILKLLAVWMWVAASSISFFIATLFNPNSSLMGWSLDHRALVVVVVSLLLSAPSYLIFFVMFQLSPIARILHQQNDFKLFSPVQVWLLCALMFCLFILALATLTSVFYA